MPWPRLKMWPGRLAAWARMRRVWRSISVQRGKQDDGVKISLNSNGWPEPVPRLGEINPPVETDHGAAGVALQLQQRAGVGSKMDRWNGGIELGEEPLHVRLNEP